MSFAGVRCCVLLLTVVLLCLTSVSDKENIFLIGVIPPDFHDGLLWLSVDHHGLGVMSRLCGLPPSLNDTPYLTRGSKYNAIIFARKLLSTMAFCLLRRESEPPLVWVSVSSPLIQRNPHPSASCPLDVLLEAISFMFPRLFRNHWVLPRFGHSQQFLSGWFSRT